MNGLAESPRVAKSLNPRSRLRSPRFVRVDGRLVEAESVRKRMMELNDALRESDAVRQSYEKELSAKHKQIASMEQEMMSLTVKLEHFQSELDRVQEGRG